MRHFLRMRRQYKLLICEKTDHYLGYQGGSQTSRFQKRPRFGANSVLPVFGGPWRPEVDSKKRKVQNFILLFHSVIDSNNSLGTSQTNWVAAPIPQYTCVNPRCAAFYWSVTIAQGLSVCLVCMHSWVQSPSTIRKPIFIVYNQSDIC